MLKSNFEIIILQLDIQIFIFSIPLMKFLLVFLFATFLFPNENLIPYKKIEPKFLETWEATYPVSYQKILKKDLIGKGIMLLKSNEYLYSFLVFIANRELENSQEKILEDGKEIEVKLYFNPKQNQYRIELGEFTEKYDQRNVLKWIK